LHRPSAIASNKYPTGWHCVAECNTENPSALEPNLAGIPGDDLGRIIGGSTGRIGETAIGGSYHERNDCRCGERYVQRNAAV